ncbi:hypothetical protein [uncultured Psychrobacter sp.]|nr:hypothetical protein [uncultured Psychrobacter sp.]
MDDNKITILAYPRPRIIFAKKSFAEMGRQGYSALVMVKDAGSHASLAN